MQSFADKLQASIERSNSFLVAGIDPRIEDFPKFLLDEVKSRFTSKEDFIYGALTSFYALALATLNTKIACVKPNIAFFEQYGLSGLKAFADIVKLAQELGLPVIADAKRGDIGSTAAAYSAAFLGRSELFGEKFPVFDADALTVNPFLGFDTLEVFLKDCVAYGKGLFVLVKTSNPGSAALQGTFNSGSDSNQPNVSEKVAAWLAEKASTLAGTCGFSGIGAVVGATYPEEAKHLRNIMPTNILLIPGMGAQGGTAKDAVAGFAVNQYTGKKGGAVINVSRGLFGGLPPSVVDKGSLCTELMKRAESFNTQIEQALQ